MNAIIGRKPVLEALKQNSEIEKIYLLFGQHGDVINQILILAKKQNINITQITQDKFNKYTQNPNAQGVVALLASVRYYSFSEIIDNCKQKKNPIILVLDSIQDTHNLGAILRTAECVGVDGVILPKHNSAPINDTVVKTSAGGVNYLKICSVPNLVSAIQGLKENGFWIVGTSLEGDKDYDEPDYNVPVGLIVGNEERGIRKLLLEKCDFLVKIPVFGKLQSLNVSVATGIMLYKIKSVK
ncbi:MAG: 23S rRNA (guanosine(2251)-2'-O)-methyltransferase RlmB [Ignavibacteriaceae bacterium]